MSFFKKLFGKGQGKEGEAAPPPPVDPADCPISAGTFPEDKLMGQGKTILVVDDNPVVLKAFDMKLKALGFDVITCDDAAAAVSIARDRTPDVMVLDINFPPDIGSSGLQWSGFTVMQWLRRFREASGIPIIIISSDDPEKVEAKALESGAAAFFHKPINNDEFLMTVRRLIKTAPASAAV